MSASVLYDVPGPRARARHRLYGVVGFLAIAALLGYIGWRLWQAEQITPAQWTFLSEPDIVSALFEGLLATLGAAASAIVLAVMFGAVFAAGKLSSHAVVRWPCIAVIEFFRAVPVLLLIFFLFLVFGDVLGRYWSLVLALMLYNGSVLAEIFRAGINAVPRGQSEAAYAIGLRKGQVLRLIQAPQAVTTMLPAIISQCVIALKDTALGYAIGAPEITRTAKQIFTSPVYNNPIAVGLMLMAVFVLINYSLSRLARWLEGRMRRQGKEAVHPATQPPT
ncbi:MAG TPA: amino acid ABC transporter permease [Nocardioidaceae bacterium]|nr:amino acid ABC transporter permease [Nocardioidaceae bacterium]